MQVSSSFYNNITVFDIYIVGLVVECVREQRNVKAIYGVFVIMVLKS